MLISAKIRPELVCSKLRILYHYILFRLHLENCGRFLSCARLRCSGMQSNLEGCAALCRMQSVSCSSIWVSPPLSTQNPPSISKKDFDTLKPRREALGLFIHLHLKKKYLLSFDNHVKYIPIYHVICVQRPINMFPSSPPASAHEFFHFNINL